MRLDIDAEGGIGRITGDRENALSNGYACFKGLQSAAAHRSPSRLLRPLKRMPDGTRVEIPLEQALDEISYRVRDLMQVDGPDAVAVFCGNGAILNSTAAPMQRAFLRAIGSRQYFSTLTIDQSAKMVSRGRLGSWQAGIPELEDMQVLLVFGANPLVSHAGTGVLNADPVKRLKAARERGLRLIVVDPRRSETAAFADLSLQPYPGQDAAIAAAMLRLILAHGWEDVAFCDRHVGADRMAALRLAVEPYRAEDVERSAGLQPGQLLAAAALFARDARVGCAYGATGPDMGPASNLAQHLIDCLNVVCGRFLREGDPVKRLNVLDAPGEIRAEVLPPDRDWEKRPPSRIRGVGDIYGERPSGTLSDEMLTPGAGRIRALFVDGGDPATSLPDRARALRALRSLDLLVAIEPWPTPTSRLAHYVLPPRLQYERADLSLRLNGRSVWPGAWAQFTPAIVDPPAGADVTDDWHVFWALASRLGRAVSYAGQELPADRPPTTEQLLELQARGTHVTLDELRRCPHGLGLDTGGRKVLPARDPLTRFDVMPRDVAEECAAYFRRHVGPHHFERDGRRFSHLLAVRRMRDFFNSTGVRIEAIRARNPRNPAYLCPQDMAAIGVAEGDRIVLETAHGSVVAVVEADEKLRPGVVSIAHGWGDLPDGGEAAEGSGVCVNELTETVRHVETINAMPQMTAIPVDIRRLEGGGR